MVFISNFDMKNELKWQLHGVKCMLNFRDYEVSLKWKCIFSVVYIQLLPYIQFDPVSISISVLDNDQISIINKMENYHKKNLEMEFNLI